ncbi:mas-related G-protein coupled receptor member A1-like [Heterodontus francisci]|uniref:mas-related G-protein coupled receptor member A1-like n=1 Tax=Heterodontus francisci TaxID=7792 RepID=UPI00355C8935
MMASLCSMQSGLNATGPANWSWDGEASHRRHSTIISTILVLTSVLGTPLNGLALWVLGFKLRRKNRFVVYVLNLVISDFLFLFFQAIHSICLFAGVSRAEHALLVFRSLIVTCSEASAYLLAWISVERFFSVAFPIWWRISRRKDSAVLACWVIWACSLAMGAIYGVSRSLKRSLRRGTPKEALIITEFVLAFLVPFLAFTLANAAIFCQPNRPSRKTTRLYCAITINAIIFLMCWVPYHISVFLHYQALFAGQAAPCVLAYYGAYYSVCLLHVKSCIIPLVYISISSELKIRFRESLPNIFERRFSEESGISSPAPDTEAPAKTGRAHARK